MTKTPHEPTAAAIMAAVAAANDKAARNLGYGYVVASDSDGGLHVCEDDFPIPPAWRKHYHAKPRTAP